MNERIHDLAMLARKHFPKTETSGEFWVLDEKKFAELIVEEMYVFMCNATDNDKPWPSFKEVKEHFGVEE